MNSEKRRAQYRAASARYTARHPERRKEIQRAFYDKRKEAGVCTRCGNPERLTEAVCWGCLNAMEEGRLCQL